MAGDIDGVLIEVEVREQGTHGGGVGVEARHAGPGRGVVLLEVLAEQQEVAEPALLEDAQQI